MELARPRFAGMMNSQFYGLEPGKRLRPRLATPP
ncbi:MAG: hypothetical protein JWN13_2099 [Betaproteobacteria bacterium]|nr:hypothetical protein [Betaproteobacteria bacterium]